MAKSKKKTQQKKRRRRINWQQVVFVLIAGAMILTMILSMIQ
jgi:amino acid transporter